MAKYLVEYETVPGPDAVIDGTNIADLKGWPTTDSFCLPAVDDVSAMELTKEWYSGIDKHLGRRRRMSGEPRLLKITTLAWRE